MKFCYWVMGVEWRARLAGTQVEAGRGWRELGFGKIFGFLVCLVRFSLRSHFGEVGSFSVAVWTSKILETLYQIRP